MSFFTHPWIQWGPDIKLPTHKHTYINAKKHPYTFTHMNGQYWLWQVKALFFLLNYSNSSSFCRSAVVWGYATVASLGPLSWGVLGCVCVCVREKAESNKLAEMVPSELHDWSIEFHHSDWPVGLNGLLWVTRLKHHTAFICLLIGLPSETWTMHSPCSQHLCMSASVTRLQE